MPNPINRLKQLPWGATLRQATIVVVGVVAIEWAIVLAVGGLAGLNNLSSGLLLAMSLLGGACLGVATTELWRYQNNNYLETHIVWTLIGSVTMLLILRWLLAKYFFGALLPPALLSEPSSVLLMGMVMGGFWRFWGDRFRR